MDITTTTKPNGLLELAVTPKILDDFLLWRLNEGVLYKDGFRLVYDKMPDGSVKLKLLVIPDPESAKFSYTDEAASNAVNAWTDFTHSVR